MKTQALERLVTRGPRAFRAAEPCGLCAATLREDHPHLLDTNSRKTICVCRPCSLLFDRDGASLGHYRTIPERRLRLSGVDPSKLRVPVGLAFFVLSDDGTVVAHYPSPAGATRWDVDAADWEAVVQHTSQLCDLEPEVEALLVNTAKGLSETWIVPLSDCYRLVGIVVETWEGLSGGDRVWRTIEGFFTKLNATMASGAANGTYTSR